ncbi:MAG TPA: hypothetical protein VJ907_01565 [Halanaerobiales bacterium]|nr:hypothetical protein [Halanaerobiales bacterium]
MSNRKNNIFNDLYDQKNNEDEYYKNYNSYFSIFRANFFSNLY